MVKLFYGEERYLIDKNLEKEISEIEVPEMNLSTYEDGFAIETVENVCSTEPFLADKRAVVLKLSELKPEIKELVKKVPENTKLLIVADKVDKRSSVFKALQNCSVCCTKPEVSKVVALIATVADKEGCSVERQAAEEIVQRLGYFTEDGVNLYAVIGAVRQLANSGNITLQLVKAMLPENAAGKVWNLLALIVDKRTDDAFALLSYLLDSGESGIAVLSVLLKSFRLAWKESVGVPDSVPRFQYAAATKLDEKSLIKAQEILEDGIEKMKSGMDAAIACKVAVAKLVNL